MGSTPRRLRHAAGDGQGGIALLTALPPAEEAYLAQLVERLRASLGSALLGAYLTGSASLGDYLPGRSDLDVIVTTEGHLREAERRRLLAAIRHHALPCPARKLELVSYPLSAVRDEPPSLLWDLNLETGPGEELIAADPSSQPAHWFVLDASIAGDHGAALVGPPAWDTFSPVARDRVLASLRESIAWYRKRPDEDAVLAACRAWHHLRTGAWVAKSSAGAWARDRAPDPSVVDAAVATRAGVGLPPSAEDVVAFLDLVDRHLERGPVPCPDCGGQGGEGDDRCSITICARCDGAGWVLPTDPGGPGDRQGASRPALGPEPSSPVPSR